MTIDLTRNDLAAFQLFKKMMTRLADDQYRYGMRAAAYLKQQSAFQQLNGGYTHSLGATIAAWTPYMTASEWETFSAYMAGEEVILHVLAETRD